MLTGARQTGKTTLLQNVLPNLRMVSLDLPSEAEQAEKDPQAFLTRHGIPLIIDEVQYAPSLFRHLKSVVDADRTRNGTFVLCGSQRFSLMKEVADSLAGRADIVELEGLSLWEVRTAHPALGLDEIILRGGFPELYADLEIDVSAFFRSYLATYLERDVRQLLAVGSLRDFERFVRACALRSGQLLNRSELARDVGVSSSTATAWLSVLEASGQVTLLEPWFSNRTKALVKSPKLYMTDSGLCAFLMGITHASELHHVPMIGALWETFVFSQLRRRSLNATGRWEMSFYRDRAGEVDFLHHRGGLFRLADAKWTESATKRDTAQLERVSQELKHVEQQAIFCRTPNPYPVTPNVQALPVEELDSWSSP